MTAEEIHNLKQELKQKDEIIAGLREQLKIHTNRHPNVFVIS